MIPNIANSLKELSSTTGLEINHLRVLVALERAVARLEYQPMLSDLLVFKGGFALLKKLVQPVTREMLISWHAGFPKMI